jgi:hypothetical protein
MKVCVAASAVVAIAGSAFGQGEARRVYTDSTGTYLREAFGSPRTHGGGWGGVDSLLWTFNDPIAIPESVALSPGGGSAWVGQTLNSERLQRFAITGAGVPTFESPGGSVSPSIVAASENADLAVYLDQPDSPPAGTLFQVRAYNAAGTALWARAFPDIYTGAGYYNLKVSRDGSTVAVALNQGNAAATVFFLNGSDGSISHQWDAETGTVGSVDMTDNGGLAFMLYDNPGSYIKLINVATGADVFNDIGTGAGGAYQISGDGSVLVAGGFNLYVYKLVGGTYTRIINFSAPTSWFGWGAAVSHDGSTVGVMSHNYGANYLQTSTRIWDVASTALLGTYNTVGTGGYQDSIVGGWLSDHGDRFMVASWGTQDNAHPEVMVFDRHVNLINSLDTPGSPFSIDLSGDGRYGLVGSKSVHANVFGNGGNTYVMDLGALGGSCYANCDGSTSSPVLNVADFTCFLQKFGTGDPYANCDASTTPPTLNVADFTCFLQKYALGCP